MTEYPVYYTVYLFLALIISTPLIWVGAINNGFSKVSSFTFLSLNIFIWIGIFYIEFQPNFLHACISTVVIFEITLFVAKKIVNRGVRLGYIKSS
jgi:hypothetical protein